MEKASLSLYLEVLVTFVGHRAPFRWTVPVHPQLIAFLPTGFQESSAHSLPCPVPAHFLFDLLHAFLGLAHYLA